MSAVPNNATITIMRLFVLMTASFRASRGKMTAAGPVVNRDTTTDLLMSAMPDVRACRVQTSQILF
jgi:hypothetical protein